MVAEFAGLVADAVSTGLLVATADHRVVWVNRAIIDLVGALPTPGKPGAERPGPAEDLRAAARIAVAEAALPLSGVRPGDPPCRRLWVSPTGETYWIEIRCRELAAGEDVFGVGVLVVFELADVTESLGAVTDSTVPDGALADDTPADGVLADDTPADGAVADDTLADAAVADGHADAAAVGSVVAAETAAEAGGAASGEPGAGVGCSWVWEVETGRVNWSPRMLELLGFPPAARPDYDTFRALVHPGDLPSVEAAMRQVLADDEPFTFVHRITHAGGGGERVLECDGRLVRDSAGAPLHVIVVAHDVTELHRVQRELAYLAEHDALTGLRNRRGLTWELTEAFQRLPAGATERTGALLLVDIDHFRDINDLCGYTTGDTVMITLARVLREQLPEAMPGRVGGDEFAVIIFSGGGPDALEAAESVCGALAAGPVVADGVALRTTVSIGVAPLARATGGESALAQADLALREAKRAGGNCVRLFTPELYEQAAHRASLYDRLRTALHAGLLSVDAQPLADLETRQVVGYELLVRLHDGREPELEPRRVLADAERTDLVVRLDRWMVEQAVEALAARVAADSLLHLNVTISGRSLQDPRFGEFVLAALHAARVEPSRLGFVLTDSSAIADLRAVRRHADKLSTAGCRFTLDGFGVAAGSFAHLRTLPFTMVKIGSEVLLEADTSTEDTATVDAIVRIARTMGLYTIADDVDRDELAETLRELGVDFAQGTYAGRPIPVEDLLAGAAGGAVADPPADAAGGRVGGAGTGAGTYSDTPFPDGRAFPGDSRDSREFPDAGQLLGYGRSPELGDRHVYLEGSVSAASGDHNQGYGAEQGYQPAQGTGPDRPAPDRGRDPDHGAGRRYDIHGTNAASSAGSGVADPGHVAGHVGGPASPGRDGGRGSDLGGRGEHFHHGGGEGHAGDDDTRTRPFSINGFPR